jgi:starch synthase (maltosyl-transferring)
MREYMTQLLASVDWMRPNFWPNTPDILHESLQHGGPPMFKIRAVLASMLSPSWGMYSGYELFEHVARPGAEEYIDNEKFEIKQRRLDGPLLPLVQRLNQARRDNPALQRLENLQFLDTHNDALVAYAKREDRNLVITVVNVDPHNAQEGLVNVPYELGVPPSFTVTDLIDLGRYDWHIGGNYVRLDPGERAGHVLHVDTP